MGHYMDKINKLAIVAGYSINPIDKAPLTILEDEIANLKAVITSKRDALKTMDDELEKKNLELEALKADADNQQASMQREIEDCRKRMEILKTYMDTLETKDDFLINKVVKDVVRHNETFFNQLKDIHDRSDEIAREFEQMRVLQRECDELRQKAGQ